MPAIVETEDVLGGKPRIEGRRISVYQVGERYAEAGYAPEEIADQLDLSLAEVHVALAYYYEHPDEMEAIREAREELHERLRRESKSPETLQR